MARESIERPIVRHKAFIEGVEIPVYELSFSISEGQPIAANIRVPAGPRLRRERIERSRVQVFEWRSPLSPIDLKAALNEFNEQGKPESFKPTIIPPEDLTQYRFRFEGSVSDFTLVENPTNDSVILMVTGLLFEISTPTMPFLFWSPSQILTMMHPVPVTTGLGYGEQSVNFGVSAVDIILNKAKIISDGDAVVESKGMKQKPTKQQQDNNQAAIQKGTTGSKVDDPNSPSNLPTAQPPKPSTTPPEPKAEADFKDKIAFLGIANVQDGTKTFITPAVGIMRRVANLYPFFRIQNFRYFFHRRMDGFGYGQTDGTMVKMASSHLHSLLLSLGGDQLLQNASIQGFIAQFYDYMRLELIENTSPTFELSPSKDEKGMTRSNNLLFIPIVAQGMFPPRQNWIFPFERDSATMNPQLLNMPTRAYHAVGPMTLFTDKFNAVLNRSDLLKMFNETELASAASSKEGLLVTQYVKGPRYLFPQRLVNSEDVSSGFKEPRYSQMNDLEQFVGIRAIPVDDVAQIFRDEMYVASDQLDTQKTLDCREEVMRRAADGAYFQAIRTGSMAFSAEYNPYATPGLPILVYSKNPQRTPHMIGMLASATHSIDTNGNASTQYTIDGPMDIHSWIRGIFPVMQQMIYMRAKEFDFRAMIAKYELMFGYKVPAFRKDTLVTLAEEGPTPDFFRLLTTQQDKATGKTPPAIGVSDAFGGGEFDPVRYVSLARNINSAVNAIVQAMEGLYDLKGNLERICTPDPGQARAKVKNEAAQKQKANPQANEKRIELDKEIEGKADEISAQLDKNLEFFSSQQRPLHVLNRFRQYGTEPNVREFYRDLHQMNIREDKEVILRSKTTTVTEGVLERIDVTANMSDEIAGEIKASFPGIRVVEIPATQQFIIPEFYNILDPGDVDLVYKQLYPVEGDHFYMYSFSASLKNWRDQPLDPRRYLFEKNRHEYWLNYVKNVFRFHIRDPFPQFTDAELMLQFRK